MYYPAVTGLVNPLIAGPGAAAQQQLIDYSALAAVMGQNQQATAAYGLAPQGKFASATPTGLEQYATYPAGYGLVPQSAYNLGNSQLQLAAAQQQLEHQRV
uniref:Uncharacterized protein n=1 Tax=Caenorhabditis japonica TaxID=281687 RepID=A0A8R1EXJ0_CAEJA